jgi:hypothetical protein
MHPAPITATWSLMEWAMAFPSRTAALRFDLYAVVLGGIKAGQM